MSEPIETKRCSKCKEIKPVSEFYKRPERNNRPQSQCKLCQSLFRKSPKGREIHKRCRQSEKGIMTIKRNFERFRQTEKYRLITRRHARKYRANNLEKVKAQHIIFTAVFYGKMPSPKTLTCVKCLKKPAIDYHHHLGYEPEHWYDVIPVCRRCHRIIHNLPVRKIDLRNKRSNCAG